MRKAGTPEASICPARWGAARRVVTIAPGGRDPPVPPLRVPLFRKISDRDGTGKEGRAFVNRERAMALGDAAVPALLDDDRRRLFTGGDRDLRGFGVVDAQGIYR